MKNTFGSKDNYESFGEPGDITIIMKYEDNQETREECCTRS